MLPDISEFLTEEIKGPAKFSSRTGQGSRFEEPAMNQLINDIFGDEYITIDCKSGECMHASEVPGFVVRCAPSSIHDTDRSADPASPGRRTAGCDEHRRSRGGRLARFVPYVRVFSEPP